MPAIITHWLLGKKVFPQLVDSDERLKNLSQASFLWGCQGPDVLFFQRMFPWQTGQSVSKYGGKMHLDPPSRIFSSLTGLIKTCDRELYNDILSYSLGMCCHYCFDTAAHPYVVWLENKLAATDKRGSKFHYHGYIESALDVILLRRMTGKLPVDVRLCDCIPDDEKTKAAVAAVYTRLLSEIYGVRLQPNIASLLTSDMRSVFKLLDDPSGMRKPVFSALERAAGLRTAPLTAYMRTLTEPLDYDFANLDHATWRNIYDETQSSREDFFEIFARAEAATFEMAAFFMTALDNHLSFSEYTGERSFSYNVDNSKIKER